MTFLFGFLNPLYSSQNGSCKTRSAIDHPVHFETFVRERLLNEEHVVSIFYDLEKAYDTTWNYQRANTRNRIISLQNQLSLPHFLYIVKNFTCSVWGAICNIHTLVDRSNFCPTKVIFV